MPHHCGFCGKEIPTLGGVKKHILGRPDCRQKWESLIEQTDDRDIPVASDSSPPPQDIFVSPDNLAGSFSPLRRTRSASPDNDIALKIPRVTVEDAVDKDEPTSNTSRFFEHCPDAGWPLRGEKTVFERYYEHKAVDSVILMH
jgi:hypothetical protein